VTSRWSPSIEACSIAALRWMTSGGSMPNVEAARTTAFGCCPHQTVIASVICCGC
jgi:hypothetical protein